MKNIYKSLLYTALNIGLCIGVVASASAQRNGSSSTPNLSSKPSGGSSGGGGSRPSGGGSSVNVSRPAVGSGFSRPGGGMMAPRIGNSQSTMNRQGAQGGRPAYGYSPRMNSGGQPGLRANFVSPQRQGVSVNQNYASRGFYNNPQRVGASGTGGQGVVAYRNTGGGMHDRRDFWGSNNYYYHNHGYFKTYYQPRIGFTCTVLPYGYYPFFWGDAQYYYSDGLFYEYENDQYTVVEPPVGAEIASLPSDAQSIVINGQQYYESAGVYYQPYVKDDGTKVYIVAGKDGELNTNSTIQDTQVRQPQIGDIVNQLPPDCRKIIVSGQKLYVSPDGIYYQPLVDANNITTYKIVGLPSDQIDQN